MGKVLRGGCNFTGASVTTVDEQIRNPPIFSAGFDERNKC
jgi:hypothetical protein